MAISDHLITYTMTDLKVIAYESGALGATLVDLPGIRSCQITLGNDAQVLRGDNREMAVVDTGNTLEWQFEAGGMDLEALAIILGGATADAGTTPDVIRTLAIGSDDPRPYFGFVGVAPSDNAVEDLHIFVPKAKATGAFEVTAQDQEFATPTISGRAVEHTTHGLVKFVQHETAVAAAIPS